MNKYKLVREKDNLSKEGNEVSYIVWKGNGTFQSLSSFLKEGTSLALDLEQGVSSTHITDVIQKVLEQTDYYTKFEARDGVYFLYDNTKQPVVEKKTESKKEIAAEEKSKK
jgi:hypothetical protein